MTYTPLIFAILLGLAIALLNQPTSLVCGIVTFAGATMIAFGLTSCIWLLVITLTERTENE